MRSLAATGFERLRCGTKFALDAQCPMSAVDHTTVLSLARVFTMLSSVSHRWKKEFPAMWSRIQECEALAEYLRCQIMYNCGGWNGALVRGKRNSPAAFAT